MSTLQKEETVLGATSTENTSSKTSQSNHNENSNDKHGQLQRFLIALLDRDLSTYEAQQAASCSRPANLASDARKRYGLDLPCPSTRYVKSDGTPASYGVYKLTKADRKRLSEIGLCADCSGLEA